MFSCPDVFEEEQLFLILEFEFGGSDLENSNGKVNALKTTESIFRDGIQCLIGI